ncbi:MAG: hypothetical protein RL498_392 [Pseudomonadota bacterium]|jgi:hypothetical protein
MSTASSIVSFRGDSEADFEESCNLLFREVQQNLNSIHSTIRNLAMSEDRNDTFQETCDIHFQIVDYIETLYETFDELNGISKQIVGKPQNDEEKKYLKDVTEKRKQDKQRAKEEAKRLKELEKASKLEIK